MMIDVPVTSLFLLFFSAPCFLLGQRLMSYGDYWYGGGGHPLRDLLEAIGLVLLGASVFLMMFPAAIGAIYALVALTFGLPTEFRVTK